MDKRHLFMDDLANLLREYRKYIAYMMSTSGDAFQSPFGNSFRTHLMNADTVLATLMQDHPEAIDAPDAPTIPGDTDRDRTIDPAPPPISDDERTRSIVEIKKPDVVRQEVWDHLDDTQRSNVIRLLIELENDASKEKEEEVGTPTI